MIAPRSKTPTATRPPPWATTLDDISRWPAVARHAAIALLFIGLLAAGYVAHLHHQIRDLAAAKRQGRALTTTLEAKQRDLVDPDAFNAYLQTLEARLDAMLRQLPRRAEVAALVNDIADLGRANRLTLHSLSPAAERLQAGYVELPIDIVVAGGYYSLGQFVYNIAMLPRIVSLQPITLTPTDRPDVLTLSAQAMIYWSAPDAAQRP